MSTFVPQIFYYDQTTAPQSADEPASLPRHVAVSSRVWRVLYRLQFLLGFVPAAVYTAAVHEGSSQVGNQVGKYRSFTSQGFSSFIAAYYV